ARTFFQAIMSQVIDLTGGNVGKPQGWEYMTTVGQASTTGNHGGTQLRVVVQEVGYDGSGTAWMNGAVLPSSANYFNDPFCQTGSSYTACSTG
ncbi:DUF4879 domain-containing protein, partial [Xanthomonas campestris]|uniref:DUF4879 domain-containing protein n=2 Tax=Xanthomonas campestris TaxID=339 RepID=UPI002B22229A